MWQPLASLLPLDLATLDGGTTFISNGFRCCGLGTITRRCGMTTNTVGLEERQGGSAGNCR